MASSILKKYNRALENKVKAEAVVQEGPLDFYKMALNEGDSLEVPFDYASEDGSLSYTDKNGIKVLITSDSLLNAMPYYEARIKDKFLAEDFVVKIDRIDEEAGIVYVRSARENSHSTRAIISSEIKKQIAKAEEVVDEKTGQKRGGYPRVVGRVVSISGSTVYVNILDRGVLGLCNVKYWSKGWTDDIHKDAEIGAFFEFEAVGIVDTKTKQKNAREQTGAKGTMFLLSRTGVTADPWKIAEKSGIRVNDVMLIKCMRRPAKATFWWGEAPKVVPGMQIMCDYNQKVPVSIGRTYKCKITKFDASKHILQAVPFFETDEGYDENTLNNLKILKSNKVEK